MPPSIRVTENELRKLLNTWFIPTGSTPEPGSFYSKHLELLVSPYVEHGRLIHPVDLNPNPLAKKDVRRYLGNELVRYIHPDDVHLMQIDDPNEEFYKKYEAFNDALLAFLKTNTPLSQSQLKNAFDDLTDIDKFQGRLVHAFNNGIINSISAVHTLLLWNEAKFNYSIHKKNQSTDNGAPAPDYLEFNRILDFKNPKKLSENALLHNAYFYDKEHSLQVETCTQDPLSQIYLFVKVPMKIYRKNFTYLAQKSYFEKKGYTYLEMEAQSQGLPFVCKQSRYHRDQNNNITDFLAIWPSSMHFNSMHQKHNYLRPAFCFGPLCPEVIAMQERDGFRGVSFRLEGSVNNLGYDFPLHDTLRCSSIGHDLTHCTTSNPETALSLLPIANTFFVLSKIFASLKEKEMVATCKRAGDRITDLQTTVFISVFQRETKQNAFEIASWEHYNLSREDFIRIHDTLIRMSREVNSTPVQLTATLPAEPPDKTQYWPSW